MLTFFAAAKKVSAAPHRGNANRPLTNQGKAKRPKGQKTKRPKDQKTKRPKDQKTKRPKDQKQNRPRTQQGTAQNPWATPKKSRSTTKTTNQAKKYQ
ncbi:hypothetical protein KRI00_38155 [Paraburkholderia fungorum]|nr:hypothetical protein [Paraburkholderia fungorum]